MHLHALSVKFGLAASSSRRFGRCGFDVPASSISNLRGFGSIIENTREFPVRRMPRASRTGLVSASAKVSPRPTLRPLILCHTTRACSRSSRALVFRESFHFFRAVFPFFFFQPLFGSRDDRIALSSPFLCAPLVGSAGRFPICVWPPPLKVQSNPCIVFDAVINSAGHVVCRSFPAPFTCLGVAALVIHNVNLCRIGGVTGVAVRWICSGFPQSLASILAAVFTPYIYCINRAVGFRHCSDAIRFRRCCRHIVFLTRSSVVSQYFC